MFTSKERSNLRAMAQNIKPVTQVGKGGISDTLVESLSQALEARELLKISVLNKVEDDARDIAENLSAEVVAVIGKKVVLYRRSNRKDIQHVVY